MIMLNKMDKKNIEKFILNLDDSNFKNGISKQDLHNEYNISITEYLNNIIQDAKDLISYGEYKIALENLLSNLLEENIIPYENNLLLLNNIQDNEIKNILNNFMK